MNGRIAKTARQSRRFFRSRTLPSRNLRTLLLALCCAMSLTMLGAVRLAPQLRPDPLLAVSQSPIAGWNDDASQADASNDDASNDDVLPGALNGPSEIAAAGPALPAGVELLRAAPPEPEPTVVAPSVSLAPVTPQLVIPER